MKNVGKTDMTIRLIVGFVLLVVGLHYRRPWWFVVAILFIVTGATQYCPLYKVFGINSIEKEKKEVVKKTKKKEKKGK